MFAPSTPDGPSVGGPPLKLRSVGGPPLKHSHAPAIIDDNLHVRFYPGVNSRAGLVTLDPGLRPELRFTPINSGIMLIVHCSIVELIWN